MAGQTIPIDIDTPGTGRHSGESYRAAIQIPENIGHLILAREASIPILLMHSFPTILDANRVDLLMARECFVDLDPTWDTVSLASAPVPPSSWTGLLDAELRRLWDTGSPVGSIQHPSIKALVLPVWVISYWEEMLLARSEQTRWADAVKWIEGREESPLRERIIDAIARVPWGLELRPDTDPNPDRLAGNIADLLSWDWVRETHMEVASQMLNQHCTKTWMATTPYTAIRLMQVSKFTNKAVSEDQALTEVALLAKHLNATDIVFPVNIDNCHWIVYHIDLARNEYNYGVSHSSLPSADQF